MSKCTCGRTFRPPFCDGTHGLPELEYNRLEAKLKKIYEKRNVNTTIQPANEDGLSKSQDVSGPTGPSYNSEV
jgi:hypothetical protein